MTFYFFPAGERRPESGSDRSICNRFASQQATFSLSDALPHLIFAIKGAPVPPSSATLLGPQRIIMRCWYLSKKGERKSILCPIGCPWPSTYDNDSVTPVKADFCLDMI